MSAILRAVEPRAAAALTVMSIVLVSLLRRGCAFRTITSGQAASRERYRIGRLFAFGGVTRAASATKSIAQGKGAGPEGTDLPALIHRVVSAEELKAEVIVVGDVHGCFSELVTLLERCGYRLGNQEDRERFSVVLAGDLVNKGPGNVEVVKTAREESFLAVRGNHDNFILAAAEGVGKFSEELALSSGRRPLKSPSWVEQLSSEDIRWMRELPYTLSFPSLGCIVVHAGLVPGVPLEDQEAEAMSSMRNVVDAGGARGYEPRVHAKEGIAWAKAWRGPEHVYFGHDAVRGFQGEAFATGLDTGCVYGRSLTAITLPGGRVACVPAERVWSEPGGGQK